MFAENQLEIVSTFALYMLIMIAIGIYYYRRTHNMSDYFLGNRKVGAWVTSLSAEASDMSGWMLMGLPGFAYMAGLNAGWIALGLIIGTWANWRFVAARLRIYTEVAQNSITIPDFLENRFHDTSGLLRLIPAIFILIFFIIYTSAGFVAAGRLFETIFTVSYEWAVILGAVVVVFYTLIGGYLAVARTDFIQGVMMFAAILVVPVTAAMSMGGLEMTITAIDTNYPSFWNPLIKPEGTGLGFIEFISLMGWGLGYFGQPHILVRFMAIRDPRELPQATQIAMVWVIISLAAAIVMGMIGAVYLTEPLIGTQAETVFLVMSGSLFTPFLAGLIMAAVLAAIMSTASSQLLVAASAFAQDIYRRSFRREASQTELIWASRLSVLIISICSIFLAFNPGSFILDIVAYAWAGFGATFGPALLMALFWRRTTRNGLLAGILVGGITVLVWKQLELFNLYEIVPGFVFALVTIYIISKLDAPPTAEIMAVFDEVERR